MNTNIYTYIFNLSSYNRRHLTVVMKWLFKVTM